MFPDIADEYKRSFKLLRSLPCDVPLGSHPSMYNLQEKYAKIGKGPNPFIDPEGYKHELDIEEHAFLEELDKQKKAAGVLVRPLPPPRAARSRSTAPAAPRRKT